MTKFTSFVAFQITVYWGSRAVEIILGAKNRVLLPTKTARNDEIHEFCRLPDYRVTGVTDRLNRPRSQKLCVAHENGQK